MFVPLFIGIGIVSYFYEKNGTPDLHIIKRYAIECERVALSRNNIVFGPCAVYSTGPYQIDKICGCIAVALRFI